jgi:threonine aldolase
MKLATRANASAARLSAGLLRVEGAELIYPTDANMVFAQWPRAKHRAAMDGGAIYYMWPMDQSLDGPAEELISARLVCSWSTTDEDVDQFLALLGVEP